MKLVEAWSIHCETKLKCQVGSARNPVAIGKPKWCVFSLEQHVTAMHFEFLYIH